MKLSHWFFIDLYLNQGIDLESLSKEANNLLISIYHKSKKKVLGQLTMFKVVFKKKK